eukprot:TRINITY_DN13034_c0_g1_i1.p1 TRINITY_DN13034_c0_g1~~TRINITY_DN13034_c0_g1_i1.p1  ORF type:complete len:487 (+),score=163.86 TRINITY_DN13034_c0_g1_i1:63-1523(+)
MSHSFPINNTKFPLVPNDKEENPISENFMQNFVNKVISEDNTVAIEDNSFEDDIANEKGFPGYDPSIDDIIADCINDSIDIVVNEEDDEGNLNTTGDSYVSEEWIPSDEEWVPSDDNDSIVIENIGFEDIDSDEIEAEIIDFSKEEDFINNKRRRSTRKRKKVNRNSDELFSNKKDKKIKKTIEKEKLKPKEIEPAPVIVIEPDEPEFSEQEINIFKNEIYSSWEFFTILNFFESFNHILKINIFSTEKIEESLIYYNRTASKQYIKDVHIALLKQGNFRFVNKDKDAWWKVGLKNAVLSQQFYDPFESVEHYDQLPVKDKIHLLKYICEFNLDRNKKIQEYLQQNSRDDFIQRTYPLGYDKDDSIYWKIGKEDILYKETEHKNDQNYSESKWEVVGKTIDDYESLVDKFEDSENVDEKTFLEFLTIEIIPELKRKKQRKESSEKRKLRFEKLNAENENINKEDLPRRSKRNVNYVYYENDDMSDE